MSEVFADPRILSSSFFAFFQDYIERIEKREIRELSGGIDIVTERILTVRCRHTVGRLNDFTGHCHEFFQASAWNDDRIPTTMRLLSDTHKAAAFVFSELDIKMLPFDLEFFRYNYIIHDAFGGLPLKKPYYILPATNRRRSPAK
jgi:hypothetical protein